MATDFMGSREIPPKKLLTILFLAVVGCAFAFALLLASGVYWVASLRADAQAAQRLDPPPRANPRQFASARVETTTAIETPKTFHKNAILAERNNAPAAGDDIFTELFIPNLEITLDSGEYNKLRRNQREYVRATVREGRHVYTNVAIRLKGAVGSFRPLDDLPSLTVNFDKFAEGQTFHGLKKIHLNGSVQDRSLLEEKISRELFDAAGVPVPRSGHAQVTLNRRQLGLYVLVEGVNKQFLKRYFKDAGGNVYEGHSGSEVTQKMPTNSGDEPNDRSKLEALARAARQPDLALRLGSLKQELDVDRFLSFMALEMILSHWDGYTLHRNNFRIFHDRTADRMVFIPQGMDQMLNNPGSSVIPQNAAGLVARAVLEVPELRERYEARIAEIATNVFRYDAITDRIYEVSAQIQATLAENNPDAVASHAAQAEALRRRVRKRANYLKRFVVPPVSFDKLGIATLTSWQPQVDVGDAVPNQDRDEHGNTLLHIATTNFCTASWRTTARLEPGRYQFTARIRTRGVVLNPGDPRAGAGLRISRHREGQRNAGDNEWTPITFNFEVTPEKPEVELVCELRADAGEIWYDLNSLKLKRL